ncbi:MAG: tRNA lysidine(34) synthetase TilS [Luteolibacter sp.]
MNVSPRVPWLSHASRRSRYLIGVSGGADSVALLHILVEAGFKNLVVCHLDHRLRRKASNADARFVEKLTQSLDLPCEIGRSDIRQRMKQTGESLETAARHARHEFFADCATKHRCRKVLLAHHADDQAETVLWNLLRGSHGLKGMREVQKIVLSDRRTLELHRPLLALRHAELVEWLSERGHAWREDASNSEPIAVRNRLRNEVFPLMNQISGRDAVAAFVRAANDFNECENAIHAQLEQLHLLDPQGRLHLPTLKKIDPALQRAALRKFLKSAGVVDMDRRTLDAALTMLEPSGSAVINLSAGKRLRRKEARMWVE